MAVGTYTVIIGLDDAAVIRFGAAGERSLDDGWYAYTGSAFGPGGFARLDRHRRIDEGESDVRHWHIDYLLGHRASGIVHLKRSTAIDSECEISGSLVGDPVPGLGASDCGCDTHLVHSRDLPSLRSSVDQAHRVARSLSR